MIEGVSRDNYSDTEPAWLR